MTRTVNCGIHTNGPPRGRHAFPPGAARIAWRAAAFAVVMAAVPAWGQTADRIKLLNGSDVQGEIVAITPNGVEIEGSAGPKQVSIEAIREVLFGSEPDALRNARNMLLFRQDGQGALDELAKLEKGEMDGAGEAIQTELVFVKVAATARKALASGEKLDDAAKLVTAFIAKFPKTHHAYRMQELLGDLLARSGKFSEAAAAYSALDKGPPALRVRAASVRARLFYDQKQYAEAMKEFAAAEAVATSDQDLASLRQKREAQLGRASCLTQLGKPQDAIAVVQQVLAPLDPRADKELLARVYNVLGDAQRAAEGRTRDALISFLTVDLVYNSVAEDRARALFNLAELWDMSKNPERAREARQTLESTYQDSPWTKRLGVAGPSR